MSKDDVMRVMDRAIHDDDFLLRLKMDPTEALMGYDLTDPEREAITAGDIQWLACHIANRGAATV